ncbi:MAG: tetratricopeptide repeat protein [bacterium]|nr:tetratricopeptide repeat protein [bacterium]
MIGQIFLSRYHVDEALYETSLYSAWRVSDILVGQSGILFLYPPGDKLLLDPHTFNYRQARFRKALGDAIPRCLVGHHDDSLYVLALVEASMAPIRLPIEQDELANLLQGVMMDLDRCRDKGIRLFHLPPELIWRRTDGRPLYLPPVYLHYPSLLEGGADADACAPELRWGSGNTGAADIYGLGRLIERVTVGHPEWETFRADVLPSLLDRDHKLRPTLQSVWESCPISGDGRDDVGAGDRLSSVPEAANLTPEIEELLEDAVRAWRQGRSVLLGVDVAGGSLSNCCSNLEDWLGLNAEQGLEGMGTFWLKGRTKANRIRTFFMLEEISSPSLLLNPLWKRLANREPRERFFIVYDAGRLVDDPGLEKQFLATLRDLPFLHEATIELAVSESPNYPEILAGVDRQYIPLLEILSLQEEPISLSLLARIFPVEEMELFDLIEHLELELGLSWRTGIDPVEGGWGQRVTLSDPLWRKHIKSTIAHARIMELHRLCISLFESNAPVAKNPIRSILHFKHLLGAEMWKRAARDGLDLFKWAIKQDSEPLVDGLASALVIEKVERELSTVGKRIVFLHLGRQHLRQGRVDEAEKILQRGLQSLTGNPKFVDELMLESGKKPELPLLGEAVTLPAVSELVRCLADISENRGEFALGVKYLGRILDAFSEDFSARERGVLYNDLAWMYYRLGQHDAAVERCEAALRLFDPQKDYLELGQTYNTLGAAQWALANWTEAETYYKRALALRERAGNENSIAASLNNLGNLYRWTERLPLAIDYFKRSMAIKKRLKNYPGYLVSLYNVALISFEMMNDLDTARGQCLECLELNRTVGNVQIGSEVTGLLGEISLEREEYDEAQRYLDEAIKTCREIEAHTGLTTNLRRLTSVLLAQGNLGKAQQTIKEGLEVSWKVGDRFEEARIRIFEGDYWLALKDKVAAVKSFEMAADILSTLDKYEWLARVYCRIGLLQLDHGLEVEARECLRQATEIIERRKVTAMISEWDSLQVRLQQHVGYFTDRIKGEGKERLASLYQILNLISGQGELEELIHKILALLQSSFNYHRLAICLLRPFPQLPDVEMISTQSFPDEEQWLESARRAGGGDASPTAESVEIEGGVRQRLQIPISSDEVICAVLALERDMGDCDADELDFLASFARLVSLRMFSHGLHSYRIQESDAGEPRGESTPKSFNLIGKGRDMQRLRKLISQVKDVDATVLITGESGTGKEEVARSIHFSGRMEKPFLPVNCASIPATLLESTLFGHERGSFTGASHRHIGVFEEAGDGTVFLDEIGEMGVEMQAKLLRILQNKQFTRVGGTRSISCKARVLAATNQDLALEVKMGQFREDLFYRINVLRIQTAPIREKREDIPLLIDHFLQTVCREQDITLKRLSPDVLELFLKHSWPGNVRQMKNVINSGVILSRGLIIQIEDLPEDFLEEEVEALSSRSLDEVAEMVIQSSNFTEEQPLEEPLLAFLAHSLVKHVGSKAQAARLLGISKPTLYRRLKQCDIIQKREVDI